MGVAYDWALSASLQRNTFIAECPKELDSDGLQRSTYSAEDGRGVGGDGLGSPYKM